ncbi:hypothetical protein SAMN05444003_0114 [Cognatiyoonia sediminum]|uniref:Uncharacterized protein n=1 Tax=Cognatiyoonia sediminum TaxID=1508389 RepID=A0A1M5L580_9RHOB|nr:hypothetical protein [Cognatiyoonia sediminum]SHG60274.1 hypothetical protein SAMN05444003_0114 [Cognatiyoonia sediminum]
MARTIAFNQPFNILIVGQAGRLQYEALLFVASLKAMSPTLKGRIFVAEPQFTNRWEKDPRMLGDIRDVLKENGAKILPFENEHFGQSYPYGNKIEALLALPEGEPFVFFDTDTLITGDLSTVPFDFERPSASMRREGTWPVEELYWPGYTAIWKSLYNKFGLDFESSLDLSQPDEFWERYLYFNAGWFFGKCPRQFGQRFLDFALKIRDDTPEEMIIQPLDPWLDQVSLPLVIHSFGGGRPDTTLNGLDGAITCHYRTIPLLYARESDHTVAILESVSAPNKIKKWLKNYDAFKRTIYQGRGQKVRALFDQANLPRPERKLRNKIKAAGYWMR